MAIAIAGASVSTAGQGRMITLSSADVRQGERVTVDAPACAEPSTLLVDGKLFPATANGTRFELPTASLSPATYSVTVDCAGSASDPATLTVSAAVMPTVVCAQNVSPRDGTAVPLRSELAVNEAQRIKEGTAQAQARTPPQPWPTPEETAMLLGRCDKDWVWTLRLEDRLTLDVVGYSDWMRIGENSRKPRRLFVDGVELGHIDVHHVRYDPASKTDRLEAVISFEDDDATVEGRTANRKALAQVLRTARAKKWDYAVNDMPVSVGPAGGPQWPTTAVVRINPYPPGMAIAAVIAAVLLALGLMYAAWNTAILRDGDHTSPFSLAKHQMAFWFFIIFSAFLFVTVSTGQAAAMSTTALTLIGISGGTALAATAIERRKHSIDDRDRALERARLLDELDGSDGLRHKRSVPNLDSTEAARLDAMITTRTQRLDALEKALDQTVTPAPRKSQGWMTDVLSDEHGLSFHRLQMVAWTVAMVGVFVVAVWRTFAMPDFDATMLFLLGISSGTYLGFKIPEREPPVRPPSP